MRTATHDIWVGSAHTGLLGPFHFPFNWTLQRLAGRRSARRQAHRQRPDARRLPLFVESGPVPVGYLRALLLRLAKRIDQHRAIDLGERFFSVFPVREDGLACVDFLDPDAGSGREGSQMLVASLRTWFAQRWAQRQRTAVANGHYFPPPRRLRARVPITGGVRIEAGFTPGFVPYNRLMVGWLPPDGQRLARLWLLDENEAVPTDGDAGAFLRRVTPVAP